MLSCVQLLQPHRWQPTRPPHPWDSLGKNTGVGCHFLLQRMKVKSESEVTQLCPTLSNPMDCNLPGSSTHGIFQARVLEWVAIAFSYKLPILVISITSFSSISWCQGHSKCMSYYRSNVNPIILDNNSLTAFCSSFNFFFLISHLRWALKNRGPLFHVCLGS